jgi:F-type H+-transporting ATPase subunit delta
MKELIAKRYIKALKSDSDLEFMQDVTTVFSSLAESFKDDKFVSIIESPNVNIEEKSKILLDAVKVANSKKVDNFIKILVENKRINVIPTIADELHKYIANATKIYSGVIYSDTDIDANLVEKLSTGLSKKI